MPVISVHRACAEARLFQGRSVLTGIGKRRTDAPAAVNKLGLDGDQQAGLSVHGVLSKAVHAHPFAHCLSWRRPRAEAGVGPREAALRTLLLPRAPCRNRLHTALA